MNHIGIDAHKKESQICTPAEGGELLEQRIRTEPERFDAVLTVDTLARPFAAPRRHLEHRSEASPDLVHTVSGSHPRERVVGILELDCDEGRERHPEGTT